MCLIGFLLFCDSFFGASKLVRKSFVEKCHLVYRHSTIGFSFAQICVVDEDFCLKILHLQRKASILPIESLNKHFELFILLENWAFFKVICLYGLLIIKTDYFQFVLLGCC